MLTLAGFYSYGIYLDYGTVLPEKNLNFNFTLKSYIGISFLNLFAMYDITLIFCMLWGFIAHTYIINLSVKLSKIINTLTVLQNFFYKSTSKLLIKKKP